MTEGRAKLGFGQVPRLPPFMELSGSYRFANPEGAAKWFEIEQRSHTVQSPPQQFASTITIEAIAASGRPIMLMAGDADIYLPPALIEAVGERMPNAEKPITIMRGAGHAPFWEQPAAFNAAVMDFIRRNP
jgi:pimeloyl-ACP methyl ester carboxylesterase